MMGPTEINTALILGAVVKPPPGVFFEMFGDIYMVHDMPWLPSSKVHCYPIGRYRSRTISVRGWCSVATVLELPKECIPFDQWERF